MVSHLPSLTELSNADDNQIIIWYTRIFGGLHDDDLERVIDVLHAWKRPVIRFIGIRWVRRKGYFLAEVDNINIRHRQLRGGRQGFGYNSEARIALMEAAVDWYVRIDHMKKETAPK